MLALVLGGFGQPLRSGHWTDHVFVAVRRLHSLRTEVLTLLVAELIALTYYSSLRDAARQPALKEVFTRIHADEVVHVEFHAATLPTYLADFSPIAGQLARLGWNAMVVATGLLVAIDHRRALRYAGVSTAAFVRSVGRDRRELSARLFGPLR